MSLTLSHPKPNPKQVSLPLSHPKPTPKQVSFVLGATVLYAVQPCPALDGPARRGAGAGAADEQAALETALPLIKGEAGEGAGEVGGRRPQGEGEALAGTAASKDSRR